MRFFVHTLGGVAVLSAILATALCARAWGPETPLTDASASFLGEHADDWAGGTWDRSCAAAGDLDGDGLDDLVIGARENDEFATRAGQVYVVLGEPAGWSMDCCLSSADGSYLGEAADDLAGYAVAGAGDVDGDGFDDLLIGAPYNDEAGAEAGQLYLVLGSASGWASDVELSLADASFHGEAPGDRLATSIAGVGDVDGDGFDDLVVGSPGNNESYLMAGQVYLVRGSAAGFAPDTAIDAAAGASFLGQCPADQTGDFLAPAGDLDGDGYDDIAVGVAYSHAGGAMAGQVFVLFGRAAGWAMDQPIGAFAGASFIGEADSDQAGAGLAAAGDVNGDGFDDLLIGAYLNDEGGSAAGKSYLVLGRGSGWAVGVDLGTADASFVGEASDDHSGAGLAGLGDLDGDGYDDLAIAARYHDGGGVDAGKVYLLRGKPTGWGPSTPLAAANASFLGESPGDAAGASLAGAGDLDGDGHADLLVGAHGSDAAWLDAGQVYVLLGEQQTCPDADGDGYGAPAEDTCAGGLLPDCDDGAAAIHPGADEWCNGIDDDCDALFDEDDAVDAPTWYADGDGDGHGDALTTAVACAAPAGYVATADDCDDADAAVYPGAAWRCDGVADNDCDGAVDGDEADLDGDGWSTCAGDCDDTDAALDLADADGDGWSSCAGDCDDTDATLDLADADGDGWSSCAGDCADGDPLVAPDAPEACNGLDDDCDGIVSTAELDLDADGWMVCAGDCDDTDVLVNPVGVELCNGVDDDCDGVMDDGFDLDGDGYTPCGGPYGWPDCDDTNPAIHPGAVEACDGVDTNCDGAIPTGEVDLDDDGHFVCGGPAGIPDCDDAAPWTYPGAPEQCDGEDNDCDLEIDEGTTDDLDGDGYTPCGGPDGDLDCNDADPEIHPGAVEACNGLDDDCDGALPDDELDRDGDGYLACTGGPSGGDCDDGDAALSPADGDGDGHSTCDDPPDCDDADAAASPDDLDGDGHSGCDDPPDCDDGDGAISPDAEEICGDLRDNDCDGYVDRDDADCADDGDDDGDDDDYTDEHPVDDDITTLDEDEPTCRCEQHRAPGRSAVSVLVTLALAVAAGGRRRRPAPRR